MKNLFLVFILLVTANCVKSQSFTPPTYIPPYHILNTDSVFVTPANLHKNKPVMIIYFAPDCSHCQHLMHEMEPKINAFKDVQVVMITFALPLKATQNFYRDFGLKKYPNFTVGTEGYTYVVQKFYSVKTTPYIALYDKTGKLIKAFEKAPKIDELIETFKKG